MDKSVQDVAVQFQKVGYQYRPDSWVFRNYSASVPRGSTFAVLGPNGRGKTTLLKIILGALKPTEGTLRVDGQMAFVPQLFEVMFDYTVLDMVLMGRARQVGMFSQPSVVDEEAALTALDRFGIANFASRPFHELSGGERQMVIFARALVTEANILILDEPTSALDLRNQILVLDWISRLSHQHGLTVFFTTHHPHHALAVSDHALLMLAESEFASGKTSEVLSETNLRSLYEVDIRLVTFDHRGKLRKSLVPVFPDTWK